MIAEVLLGRATQSSPVAAFQKLTRPAASGLASAGWAWLAGFLILSFYSVVAGWTLHYVRLAVTNAFAGAHRRVRWRDCSSTARSLRPADQTTAMLGYHGLFMAITVAMVFGGVQAGIERWSQDPDARLLF